MLTTTLLAPPAAEQFKAFDKPLRKALTKWLTAIRNQPRPPGVKQLAGENHLYRVREGDYRIVYAIRDNSLLVLAIKYSARMATPRT